MSDSVLIAYATKHGGTEGVAQAIGKAFSEEGARAEVKSVHEVEELSGYRAVVLGSPLYSGKVLPEVVSFAKQHGSELSAMPLALFFVCLTMARPSEKGVQKVVKQTRPLGELVRPTDVGLFAGSIDYSSLGFYDRMLVKLTKIPEGDFRNWRVIERWAKDLLPQLTEQTP